MDAGKEEGRTLRVTMDAGKEAVIFLFEVYPGTNRVCELYFRMLPRPPSSRPTSTT